MSKDKNLKFDFSWEKFFAGCVDGAKCQDCQRMYAIQMENQFVYEEVTPNTLMEHCFIIIGKAECYKNHKSMCSENICPNAEKLIQIWKNNTLMHQGKDGLLFQNWLLKTDLQQNATI